MLPLPRVDLLGHALDLVRRLTQSRSLPAFYDRAYRLPLPSLETATGTLRRPDDLAWFFVEHHVVRRRNLRAPPRVSYEEMARVHTPAYLESLSRPETLARIFAVDPSEILVDELLLSLRLICGGTLAAARAARERRGPVMNLAGGFHHAGRGRGGGFCALNDVAIAVHALRDEGFAERIAILDLDAHPPDGTADCLAHDPSIWIGSLSGAEWGELPGVDETLLATGAGDDRYLEALDGLLARMPHAQLAFVLAGGDVLAGDELGHLGLTLSGTRRRDRRVARALRGTPSVWLPAGGYHVDAWRVFAGTGLVLARQGDRPIPADLDPLAARYAGISAGLEPARLFGDLDFNLEDLEDELGAGRHRKGRLLDYYSAEGIEYALHQLGVLGIVRRLGYDNLRVVVDQASEGDRVRLLGRWAGQDHVLVEAVVARDRVDGKDVLYLHWLTLRNPRERFDARRPALPGQEVPGLGIAREITEAFKRMAIRLGLAGIALRPAWYHVAFLGRSRFQFADRARQARFAAMIRDLGKERLTDVTRAAAAGRVLLDGKPYKWEPDLFVYWLDHDPEPVEPGIERFALAV